MGSGFVASITVPGGSQGLQGWTIEFDAALDISSIWGADIVGHVGNHYVVRNTEWNGELGPGGTAIFGFQATTGGGGTAASGFTVNDIAVGHDPAPPLPTLSVGDASMTEGNSGTQDLAFTVTLSAQATTPVTVAYATVDSTATAGSDYTSASGSLTFAPGQTTQIVHAQVASDSTVESNETLTLTLSSPNGATIADGAATGTIINDDVTPPPLTAPSAETLQAEYQSVIDRYQVNSIDFDIEGAAEFDQHSLHLRDRAMVGLQAANPDLKVSFTVPGASTTSPRKSLPRPTPRRWSTTPRPIPSSRCSRCGRWRATMAAARARMPPRRTTAGSRSSLTSTPAS